jgi:hypothetical protein
MRINFVIIFTASAHYCKFWLRQFAKPQQIQRLASQNLRGGKCSAAFRAGPAILAETAF